MDIGKIKEVVIFEEVYPQNANIPVEPTAEPIEVEVEQEVALV